MLLSITVLEASVKSLATKDTGEKVNLFWNIATKRVEKRYCTFYRKRIKSVLQQICRFLQVAKICYRK